MSKSARNRVSWRNRVLWIILLVLIFVVSFTYGFLTREMKTGLYPTAMRAIDWTKSQPFLRSTYYTLFRRGGGKPSPLRGSWQPVDTSGAEGHARTRNQMKSVGYLSGYKPAGKLKGVTAYVPGMAYDGLNLITSGHAQEAKLVDMTGHPVHRWTYEFGDAFPEFRDKHGPGRINPYSRDFWRRSYLYPNGDLLAVYDGFGLIKLDLDSELIWAIRGGAHHDLFVDSDGSIYTLTREERFLPRFDETRPVLEDFVTVLDPDGKLIRKVSVLAAFERSPFASFLADRPDTPDILHTNSIQVFDGSHADRSPIFKRGNALISPRNIDVIAILDLEAETIVWALSGQWIAQHEPELLPNGNILLLDNKGHGGMSKVIEIDPFTQEIVWAYEGTAENGFYTETSGTVHRLPNGNTLIIESNSGRVFEVTPERQIVWEYYNPERAGEDDNLIATLFDVVRVSPDFPLDWLPQPTP
jgi:hypothetical protein